MIRGESYSDGGMVSIFRAFFRNLASLGGLLFALGCLVWLVLLREDQPRMATGWEVSPGWHEEGGIDDGEEGEKLAVEFYTQLSFPSCILVYDGMALISDLNDHSVLGIDVNSS